MLLRKNLVRRATMADVVDMSMRGDDTCKIETAAPQGLASDASSASMLGVSLLQTPGGRLHDEAEGGSTLRSAQLGQDQLQEALKHLHWLSADCATEFVADEEKILASSSGLPEVLQLLDEGLKHVQAACALLREGVRSWPEDAGPETLEGLARCLVDVLEALAQQYMTLEKERLESHESVEGVCRMSLKLGEVTLRAGLCYGPEKLESLTVLDSLTWCLQHMQATIAKRPHLVAAQSNLLRALCELISCQVLDGDRLRKLARTAALILAEYLWAGKDDVKRVQSLGVASAEPANLAVLCAAMTSHKYELIEGVMDVLLDSMSGSRMGQTSAAMEVRCRILAELFSRLVAVCSYAPVARAMCSLRPSGGCDFSRALAHHVAFNLKDWAATAQSSAQKCARLLAAATLRTLLSEGREGAQSFYIGLLREITSLAASIDWPAALPVLRSFVGSMLAILRCRSQGDSKVFVIRALASFTAQVAPQVGENREIAPTGFIVSLVTEDVAARLQLHDASTQDTWARRYLALACIRSRQQEVSTLLPIAADEKAAQIAHSLSAWAAEADDGQAQQTAKQILEEVLGRGDLLSTQATPLTDQAEACLAVASMEYEEAIRVLRQKAARGVCSLLSSNRPLLQRAALRATAMFCASPGLQDDVPQDRSRPILLSLLAASESPLVRQAAASVIAAMVAGQPDFDWAKSVVRHAAASDASPAVRTVACKILAESLPRENAAAAIAISKDLLAWQSNGKLPALAWQSTLLNLAEYLFDETGVSNPLGLLELLAQAHRLGITGFVPSLLRVRSQHHQAPLGLSFMKRLSTSLVTAFVIQPNPHLMGGLEELAKTYPDSFGSHMQCIATYLAVQHQPSLSEELLAAGACRILADVLPTLGKAAASALPPQAWRWLDHHVIASSSRLSRPAMSCLCAVAKAEANLQPIRAHLCKAVQTLRAEALGCRCEGTIARAAWIAATACECCDLDVLATYTDLHMDCKGSVGMGIVEDLLIIVKKACSSQRSQGASVLIQALGFALRSYVRVAASKRAAEALTFGLQVDVGALPASTAKAVLAERSLEAVAELLQHFNVSKGQAATGDDSICFGNQMYEVAGTFSQHQPAVLRLLELGLLRKPSISDAPIRAQAISAMESIQASGVAHNRALVVASVSLLFGDRGLRHRAGHLLRVSCQQDGAAFTSGLIQGIQRGFASMLWQGHRQQLSLNGGGTLHQVATELEGAFSLLPSQARKRCVKACLKELELLAPKDMAQRLPPWPKTSAGLHLSSLRPFSKKANAGGRSDPELDDLLQQASPSHRVPLLYGHCLVTILVGFKLREAEAAMAMQELTKFLELNACAISSKYEHDSFNTAAEAEACFGAAASTAYCGALLQCMRANRRLMPDILLRSLKAKLPPFLSAAGRGQEVLADWLKKTLEDDVEDILTRCSGKRRKGLATKPGSAKRQQT